MNEKETPNPNNPKFVRSPSFPILPIDEAIEKAQSVYEQDKRSLTPFEAVVTHLGFTTTKKKGGRPARAVSTLKQYGLLDERNGQYRISDLAYKILNLPEDSPEREQSIKLAALSPKIFGKILRHYNGELPSDTAMRSYLILQEKFNPDSIADFIKVLRRTVELVNPIPEDYNNGENVEDAETQSTRVTPMQETPTQNKGQKTPQNPPPSATQTQTILPEGAGKMEVVIDKDGQLKISFAGEVTADNFQVLNTMLELQKQRLANKPQNVVSDETEQTETEDE